MSIKVLVFESDAAFAGELRNELGKLGCSTCVVDDGTVGLQQASAERPDLILLSIELPRMNGFSVCNKLKKDAALKNVPLIIMSSESSDETFEQHRKLRTRAEDYVHKPIAFGELLQHIRPFVAMEDAPVEDMGESDGIVIDDEISVRSGIEDEDEGTVIGGRIPPMSQPPKGSAVDADIDAFTESAFGMLQDAPRTDSSGSAARQQRAEEPAVVTKDFNGASARDGAPSRPPPTTSQTGRGRPADDGELHRVQAELERARARVADLEKDVASANEKIAQIREEADSEAERRQREVDELRSRAQQPAKAGGVSTREFLDLREALNKKDKEILALKELVGSREREVFEGRDKSLAIERNLAEAEEKIVARERDIDGLREKTDQVSGQLESAQGKVKDLEGRLEKTTSNLESTSKELADLQRKRSDENAAHEAQVASMRDDMAKAKGAAETAEEQLRTAAEEAASRHRAALEEAEARRQAEAQEASQEREASLARSRTEADALRAQAVATREKELRAEGDSKLAALHRAHQDELGRTRNDFAQQMESARVQAEQQLAQQKAQAQRELAAREEELVAQHTEATQAAAAVAEQQLAQTQAKAASEVAEAQSKASADVADAQAKAGAEIAAIQAKAASDVSEAREAFEAQLATAQATAAAAEERASDLGRELDMAQNANRELSDAKGASDAANEARIADLSERLRKLETTREVLEKEAVEARERILSLETHLSNESARLQKALAKWEADKGTLERAKDALAVALTQIDEVEGRPINP
jgi:CheY-like chemotaxis protein